MNLLLRLRPDLVMKALIAMSAGRLCLSRYGLGPFLIFVLGVQSLIALAALQAML